VTFELITGHVFTAPSETVTMLPGILHLTDCIERCLSNSTCKSVNFETGLCVLLSSSSYERPEALTPSQFPVFTIYAQKICLSGIYLNKTKRMHKKKQYSYKHKYKLNYTTICYSFESLKNKFRKTRRSDKIILISFDILPDHDF
jgi:hypothetical protein